MTTLHSDPRQVLTIGNRLTVGHRCIIHGCTIEDDSLIGMGAIIMTGAAIGRGSVVAAGAVVMENDVIPPFSMAVGIPAQVIRTYDEDDREKTKEPPRHYVQRLRVYNDAHKFKAVE